MQSVSSRIWTRVAVFISYDDNNYTTGISFARKHKTAPIDYALNLDTWIVQSPTKLNDKI